VDPENIGALIPGGAGCPKASREPPLDGLAGELTDKTFSRQPHKDRIPATGQQIKPPQQVEIVGKQFAEADTGIEDNAIPGSRTMLDCEMPASRALLTEARRKSLTSMEQSS